MRGLKHLAIEDIAKKQTSDKFLIILGRLNDKIFFS